MNGNAVSQHSVKMGLVMLEVYQSVCNGWGREGGKKKRN